MFKVSQPVAVQNVLQRLNRYLPFRHRHVLTRHNTVRLRYVAVPVCAAVMAVGLAAAPFGPSVGPVSFGAVDSAMNGASYAALAPAASADAADLDVSADAASVTGDEIQLAAVQKRMSRYANFEGMTGKTVAIERAAPVERPAKEVKIAPGDTLTGALLQAGVSDKDAYGVVQAIKEHVNPRSIRPGQVLQVSFDSAPVDDGEKAPITQVSMALDALKTITVARTAEDSGFKSAVAEKPVVKKIYTQGTDISVSVVGSAARAGIPSAVVNEAIRIYSWDVDFQRDIRQGDKIEITYEAYETEDGQRVKAGDILYTKLSVSGIDIPLYRYETSEGRVDYFQPNGRSIRKTLMKTPIDGARISSNFGVRKHPVLGYTKMHKGMDFAAPTGTPIYAAGDGVVERADRFAAYGNYVRIRHNSQLKTAYAHMSRFGKGITAGTRVRQGQVIGYVGTTGRSTGPHLHYEVLVNGEQKDPRRLDLPTGGVLEGDDVRLFKAHVKQVDRLISDGRELRLARNTTAEE